MTIEINIDQYLTEEDRARIAEEMYREVLAAKIRDDSERIISNVAYQTVSRMCDDVIPDFHELVVEKVKGVVTKLTASTVFDKPDHWGKGNKAHAMLEEIVAIKRERIEHRVEKIIDEMNPSITDLDIDYEIRQMILKRLGWEERL